MHPPQKCKTRDRGAGEIHKNFQKFHRKNRYDEECLIQKLLIHKSGASPAQVAVNGYHKSARIVSDNGFFFIGLYSVSTRL